MDPIRYTVQRIDGDYAILVADDGAKNRVARALLPEETEEGCVLLLENFSYRIIAQ